jgi:hypothetical protein
MNPEDFDKFKKDLGRDPWDLPPKREVDSYFDSLVKKRETLNAAKRPPTESFAKLLAYLGGLSILCILGAAACWLYGIFAYGFVITCMWEWFVLPLFPALASVKFGILQAAGLLLFVRFFTVTYHYTTKAKVEKTTSDKVIEIVMPIIFPWISLFFAWALHLLF